MSAKQRVEFTEAEKAYILKMMEPRTETRVKCKGCACMLTQARVNMMRGRCKVLELSAEQTDFLLPRCHKCLTIALWAKVEAGPQAVSDRPLTRKEQVKRAWNDSIEQ